GRALRHLAMSWFALHLMYRLFDAQGITIRHFRWSAAKVARLRKLTRRLAWVLLPMVLVISVATTNPEHLHNELLCRLVMSTPLPLSGLSIARMMRQSQPLNNSRVFPFAASVLLVMAPLILPGRTIWGSHYPAVRLADRMIDTLYLITAWI